MNPQTLVRLCRHCAHEIYGNTRPSSRYAEQVARLLAGTAATESHLQHRRQYGFGLSDPGGAWGLWQTEDAAVGDSLAYLRRRPDVLHKCSRFVYGDEGELVAIFTSGTQCIMKLIHDNDRIACLFARLHYLRFLAPVPSEIDRQAAYWKKYYNTTYGKGTVEKYVRDYNRLVKPAIGAVE